MMSQIMDGLREPHPRSRFLWWWQHHPWVLASVDIALWVPAFALAGWIQWPFTGLAVVFGFVMSLSVAAHSRAMLCPGCSFNRLPDDPDAEVTRYTLRLKIFHGLINLMNFIHRRTGHRRLATSTIFSILWMVIWLVSVEVGMIPIGPHQQLPVGLVGIILVGAYFSTVGISHTRLVVWCPWCRDDGGDDDPVVEPAPDPEMEKTLV